MPLMESFVTKGLCSIEWQGGKVASIIYKNRVFHCHEWQAMSGKLPL